MVNKGKTQIKSPYLQCISSKINPLKNTATRITNKAHGLSSKVPDVKTSFPRKEGSTLTEASHIKGTVKAINNLKPSEISYIKRSSRTVEILNSSKKSCNQGSIQTMEGSSSSKTSQSKGSASTIKCSNLSKTSQLKKSTPKQNNSSLFSKGSIPTLDSLSILKSPHIKKSTPTVEAFNLSKRSGQTVEGSGSTKLSLKAPVPTAEGSRLLRNSHIKKSGSTLESSKVSKTCVKESVPVMEDSNISNTKHITESVPVIEDSNISNTSRITESAPELKSSDMPKISNATESASIIDVSFLSSMFHSEESLPPIELRPQISYNKEKSVIESSSMSEFSQFGGSSISIGDLSLLENSCIRKYAPTTKGFSVLNPCPVRKSAPAMEVSDSIKTSPVNKLVPSMEISSLLKTYDVMESPLTTKDSSMPKVFHIRESPSEFPDMSLAAMDLWDKLSDHGNDLPPYQLQPTMQQNCPEEEFTDQHFEKITGASLDALATDVQQQALKDMESQLQTLKVRIRSNKELLDATTRSIETITFSNQTPCLEDVRKKSSARDQVKPKTWEEHLQMLRNDIEAARTKLDSSKLNHSSSSSLGNFEKLMKSTLRNICKMELTTGNTRESDTDLGVILSELNSKPHSMSKILDERSETLINQLNWINSHKASNKWPKACNTSETINTGNEFKLVKFTPEDNVCLVELRNLDN